MFDKLKMKFAARRVKNTRRPATKKAKRKTTRRGNFWGRAWNIICWPFRMIGGACRWVWNKICQINLVGLVNIALLVAIIALFSMLIIDVIGCRRQQVVIVAKPVPVTEQVTVTDANAPEKITLPLKQSRNVTARPTQNAPKSVNVVPVKRAEVAIAKKQIAKTKSENKFWGDVIIDSRGAGAMLTNGAQVNGNLYLQNMRKYTLPCDIRINGNLFLRDMNMLQFCGDFVITGNIYVSPRSSFGPIPKTARLGGHVVL